MATMEDLTKTQIILLTLLVSFVTSIATGIITTSLLAEAPASVTQTINRVVETTIEKVVPEVVTKPGPGTTIIKEVTVVKEEDAILSSIDSAGKAVVRIKQARASGADEAFYGLGVIVSGEGLVITDKKAFYDRPKWKVWLPSGASTTLELIAVDDVSNLVLFKIVSADGTPQTYPTVPLSRSELRLGQSVIAVEGIEKNIVSVGRVLGVNTGTEGEITTVYSVDTDIKGSGVSGSPLLNLSGELTGVKTSKDDYTLLAGSYTALASVRRLIYGAR